jgi:hypothetical protein
MPETLEQRFRKAVWLMSNAPRLDIDNSVKLLFYSYFKQVRHFFEPYRMWLCCQSGQGRLDLIFRTSTILINIKVY